MLTQLPFVGLAGPTPPAVAGASSTKWRIYFPSGTTTGNPKTSSVVQCNEIEMRGTSGGANLCSGGTASASTEFSGSYTAAKALDASTGTGWASGNTGGQDEWWQYEFASAVTINELVIQGSSTTTISPTSLWLQYWDGAEWQTYLEVAGPLAWTSEESKTFTQSAPYAENGYTRWRLYMDSGCSGSFIELMEIEMRAAASGADRCFGGVGSSYSRRFSSTYTSAKAFDNLTTGQGWVPTTGDNGTGDWIEWQFWRKEDIAEFTVRCNAANSGPQQVSLQDYDTDLASWQTAYTSSSGLTWSSAETKTFTL